jgi:NADPH2:quinone reductase
MKKVIVNESGSADVLQVVNADIPKPKAGEVVVEVEAAGINYLDVYQRSGSMKVPTPFVPGFEGVGHVRQVGDGVATLNPGARVAWINVPGSYAEHIVLPVKQVIVIPEKFSKDEAMLFQGVTAQYLLADHRTVKSGDVVLVHSAAGGVGQLLVMWLKHLGAVVIGTASSEDKLSTIRSLGADHAINYSNGFLEAVRDLTGGRGVNMALDAVGKATFSDTVKALAPRGMAISYGHASGLPPDVEMMPLMLKGARVAGASLFVYIDDPEEMQRRATNVIHGIREGWLRVGKTTTFRLDDVVAAHRAIEGRSTQGKLTLVP